MRAVVQRVNNASLFVDDKLISQIEKGLVVLLGIKDSDTEKEIDYFTDKISKLRIFEDHNAKMNLSVNDIKGQVLVVSNFTLYGNTKGTNRPDFIAAAKPDIAKPLYEKFTSLMAEKVPTKTGIFGADMKINMQADGPVTIVMDSEK